jgi:hypothetical protein
MCAILEVSDRSFKFNGVKRKESTEPELLLCRPWFVFGKGLFGFLQ